MGAILNREAVVPVGREGTFAPKLETYTAPSVLVIDDLGLLPLDRRPRIDQTV